MFNLRVFLPIGVSKLPKQQLFLGPPPRAITSNMQSGPPPSLLTTTLKISKPADKCLLEAFSIFQTCLYIDFFLSIKFRRGKQSAITVLRAKTWALTLFIGFFIPSYKHLLRSGLYGQPWKYKGEKEIKPCHQSTQRLLGKANRIQ